jgi:hypothetical protein
MTISILPLLVKSETIFMRAPGLEETEEVLYPGEKSITAVAEGVFEHLNTGLATLVILPVLAAILYRTGYRVAGPMLALVTLGLFLARMIGSPT